MERVQRPYSSNTMGERNGRRSTVAESSSRLLLSSPVQPTSRLCVCPSVSVSARIHDVVLQRERERERDVPCCDECVHTDDQHRIGRIERGRHTTTRCDVLTDDDVRDDDVLDNRCGRRDETQEDVLRRQECLERQTAKHSCKYLADTEGEVNTWIT